METLYFKQPELSAQEASRMMEKYLLGKGENAERINPFKIRLSTGHFMWKANVDIEFSKKEDQLVMSIDRNLLSGALKSGISMFRSDELSDELKNIARYLFEEPIRSGSDAASEEKE